MAGALDLTLPATVPAMQQYHDSSGRVLPFALYTLCDLKDEIAEDLRGQCATDIDDDMVKLPPRVRFDGETLQTIVDYHVQLGLGGDFDPTYFLVCTHHDATTILVVTLDDDDLECKPDKMWTNINQSGLLLVNLQITNTDWFEAKDGDVGLPTDDRDDDENNADDDDDDDDDDKNDGDTNDGPTGDQNDDDEARQNATTKDPQTSHDDYGPPPPLGFHIQVYFAPGIDKDILIPKLEPMSYMKKPDRSDWVCKPVELPQESKHDPPRHAASIHPRQCSKHLTLEKKFFIVADAIDYKQKGVSIVHMDWDGTTDSQTEHQLLELGRKLKFETQRAEASETANRAAVATVCLLAQGYTTWRPKIRQFATYYPKDSRAVIKLAKAMDPLWSDRGHGEQRIVFGGSVKSEEIQRDGGFWPVLIKQHIAVCSRHRFVPEFAKEFLVYCDDEDPSEDSQVQLVKLDWNGDLQQAEHVVADYKSTATMIRATASLAHKILMDLVDGQSVWDGETLS